MSDRRMIGRVLLVLVLVSGCGRAHVAGGDAETDAGLADTGPIERPDGGRRFELDAGLEDLPLSLSGVSPSRGPFTGGEHVVLRGAGFVREGWSPGCTSCGTVRFGTREAIVVAVIDEHRLEVSVPAGEVGPVDVTVEAEGERATLISGYEYLALSLEPREGGVGGGTWVVVSSAVALESGDALLFDGSPCTDLVLESPSRATCRTPRGELGPADVVLERADGSRILAPEAFTYINTRIPGGGLGGGPILGTVDVVVLGGAGPVEGAFVMLGEDEASPHRGWTDADGHITFSDAALRGPVNLHARADCHITQSWIGFDARHATLQLGVDPHDATCAEGSSVSPRSSSVASGELIWGSGDAPAPWANVPEPGPDEVRVAYVLTTRVRADIPNHSSRTGDVRVDEATRGARGYPYRIETGPGVLAVYALAGVASGDTFVPHVMGIARGVVTRPGVETSGVDIVMNIPLDRSIDLDLTDLPSVSEPAPTSYTANAYLVINEGVIFRERRFEPLDRHSSPTPSFRFAAQPALEGELAGARYTIEAEWGAGSGSPPSTRRIVRGLRDVGGRVTVGDFLDIPTVPATAIRGEGLTRHVEWSADAPHPDVQALALTFEWRARWILYVRGDLRSAAIPDLSRVAPVPDDAVEVDTVTVSSRRVPGASFDRLRYEAFGPSAASHMAGRTGMVGTP